MAKADGKKDKKSDSKPKGGKAKKGMSGYEALAKFAEHPLVTDLLAVGAMAAVAALSESGAASKTGAAAAKGSRKAVKAAGKAAAAAIGQRLLKEIGGGAKAAKKAAGA